MASSLEMQRFDILSVIEYFTRRISELQLYMLWHCVPFCAYDCLIS